MSIRTIHEQTSRIYRPNAEYMSRQCLRSGAEICTLSLFALGCVINTTTQNNSRASFQLLSHRLSSEVRTELKAGTWELKQRPWRTAAPWLALRTLISLLSCTTQNHLPRVALSTLGWTLPQQSLTKKALHSLMEVIPQLRLPFQVPLDGVELTKANQHIHLAIAHVPPVPSGAFEVL